MYKSQTSTTEISLLGFQNLHNFRIPLLTLFLLMYILTVCEHVLIIVLVSTNQNLQTPMYFFLQQLSISDLLETTNICLLLTIMSFDRYQAISKPLHYTSIMNHKVWVTLTSISWATGVFIMLILVINIETLQFCKQNTIDYFFCDLAPLLEISCLDTSLIRSGTGGQKAFSTCSSHLAVVSIIYGTLISIYVIDPGKESMNISKTPSLLNTVVVPFVNPTIYSLKNNTIKEAFRKLLVKKEQVSKHL
ncbi:hypothetical protein GDO86_007046 [Hymenochirus boettgeri]|uniref:G-protein coupled receptors family 1 profile domain-containing protein n=1 Tax=Hymenochirus boettgeri TaxID=247094 RepID=A0A8T2JGD7_9PIPI|nr:hypothetical protein GDO86_007046 [Hymenochirus boettgeri]